MSEASRASDHAVGFGLFTIRFGIPTTMIEENHRQEANQIATNS